MSPVLSKLQHIKDRHKLIIFDSEEQKNRLCCVICKDLPVVPCKSICGCLYCPVCTKVDNKYCLGCTKEIEIINKRFVPFIDVEREIFDLRMKCLNEPCLQIFQLKHLNDHLNKCVYRMCPCKDCGCEMTKKDLEEEHKNINGDINSLCDHWRGICPYKCCEEVHDNIKLHLNICPRILVECVMKNIGCTKRIPRIEMDDHVRTDAHHHMTLMMVEINNLRRENDGIKKDLIISNKRSIMEMEKFKQEIVRCEENVESFLKFPTAVWIDNDFGMYSIVFPGITSLIHRREKQQILRCNNNRLIPGFIISVLLTINCDTDSLSLSVNMKRDSETNVPSDHVTVITVEWNKSPTMDASRPFYLPFGADNCYLIDKIAMNVSEFLVTCNDNGDLEVLLEVCDVPKMEGESIMD